MLRFAMDDFMLQKRSSQHMEDESESVAQVVSTPRAKKKSCSSALSNDDGSSVKISQPSTDAKTEMLGSVAFAQAAIARKKSEEAFEITKQVIDKAAAVLCKVESDEKIDVASVTVEVLTELLKEVKARGVDSLIASYLEDDSADSEQPMPGLALCTSLSETETQLEAAISVIEVLQANPEEDSVKCLTLVVAWCGLVLI